MKLPETPDPLSPTPRKLLHYLYGVLTRLSVRQGKKGTRGGGDSRRALCVPGGSPGAGVTGRNEKGGDFHAGEGNKRNEVVGARREPRGGRGGREPGNAWPRVPG